MKWFQSFRASMKQMHESFDKTLDDMEKTFENGNAEVDLDEVADGTEKVTVTEEVRPDGTRITTKTVLRRSTAKARS